MKHALASRTASKYRLIPPAWLWVAILVYMVTYSTLAILKHNTFHSYTYDLGIMSQVLWNTAQGRPFEISLDRPMDTELVGSYLGNHVYPILLAVALLYRLWPDPRLLLILQSVVLGLGAVPLYWIARRELRYPWLVIGLIVSYLLYPALGYLNLFDFHPIALSIPFLLFAYWALLERRRAVFWIAIILALTTKEEMIIPIGAFGIYCLTRQQWRRQGLWLLILSVLWGFLCFGIIIPHYNQGRPFRYTELWSHLLSKSPARADTRISGQVGTTSLLSRETFLFLFYLLLPLGFLPLLAPDLLAVSLPSLVYLLLGNRPALHRVGYHYPAVLIPWLFLAAVYGMARMEQRLEVYPKRRWEHLPLYLLMIGTLVANLALSPILFHWRSGSLSSTTSSEKINAALAQIPSQAGVATINSFGAHLSHRRYLMDVDMILPMRQDHLQHADYILLDLVDCRAVIVPEPRDAYAQMLFDVLQTQEFGVRYWSDRILLLERGLPLGPEVDELRAYVDELVREQRPCWP